MGDPMLLAGPGLYVAVRDAAAACQEAADILGGTAADAFRRRSSRLLDLADEATL